jgi:hypothetical protein
MEDSYDAVEGGIDYEGDTPLEPESNLETKQTR